MKTDHQNRERIYIEISTERTSQHTQWGGESHDDGHPPDDWLVFIEHQIKRARDGNGHGTDTYESVRARLVKIAALAVAGIESIDRTLDT